jgi:mxaK protein
VKRIPAHALFGTLTLAAAGMVAVSGLRLQQLNGLNASIAMAAKPLAASDAKDAAPATADAPREVRLARATALAQAGAHDAAFKSYSGLIDAAALDPVGRAALFNLGNMYLRQALGPDAAVGGDTDESTRARLASEAGPLIELAKQRYRDLLRSDPLDWDARYNLERALRLAPEEQPELAEAENIPVERRQVMLRGMEPGDLP